MDKAFVFIFYVLKVFQKEKNCCVIFPLSYKIGNTKLRSLSSLKRNYQFSSREVITDKIFRFLIKFET